MRAVLHKLRGFFRQLKIKRISHCKSREGGYIRFGTPSHHRAACGCCLALTAKVPPRRQLSDRAVCRLFHHLVCDSVPLTAASTFSQGVLPPPRLGGRSFRRGVDLISNSPKHGEEPSPQHP